MTFKKYIIGFSFGLAIAATSCTKVIEVAPDFAKDGSVIYTSLTDYEYALTGAYANLRTVGYYGNGGQTTGAWSTLPDMMCEDLLQTTEDLANFATMTNWNFVTTESDISIPWQAAYAVIAQTNLTLRNIDQFAAASQKRVNRIKGQALALRAMAHFDLLRYWGVDYDRNSTALGIPYVTVVDVNSKPTRGTVKDNYDKILADLTSAETLLGDVDVAINSAASKANIDINGVRGLLARVNLYAKQYAAAEGYATQVITAVPLASKTDFPNIWKDASRSEVIFSVAFSNAADGSPSNNLHISSTNRNRHRPTAGLMALFTDKVADIRYVSYVASRNTGATAAIVTDPASTITRKIVNKYIGKSTNLDNVVDWKVMRTGEMYLIRAEARAMQTGKEALALADLNDLRAARINGYTPVALTGTALVDAIFTERRKELFAEGHRWFDLKRTTRSITRTDLVGAAVAVTSSTTLLPASRIWVFPIPQDEVDYNPNIKPQQSPNW